MANEFFTLIVVPHAKARFRKIHVPVRLARWTAGLAGVLLVGTVGALAHYSTLTAELLQLRDVRTENAALLQKTAEYEERAGRLQDKVRELERMVNKLGVMAGIETIQLEPGAAGLGGSPSGESLAPSHEALQALPTLERDVEDLATRSERLEEFYSDQTLMLASTPSIWPVRGYLSSGFGNRIDPFTGQKDFHPGIDISSPLGTKIVSPADGIVVKAGAMGAYGNAVVINHGFGIMTRYGHMASYDVRPGQRIRRGEVIGYVGNSGRSNAPHCHYEVWVRDQLQNPIHFILDEYRSFG